MIAVIQFRKDKSLEHERECFRKHLSGHKLDFIPVFSDEFLKLTPEYVMKTYRKVMFAGSGELLLSRWDKNTAEAYLRAEPLLKDLVKADYPTFGICFGHQLLSKVLGCKVEQVASMAEAGIQTVRFTEEGHKDPLYDGIDDPLSVAVGHEDSVLKLPDGAVHLAYGEKCTNQSYRVGKNVYTAQFHVELDENDLRDRLSMYKQYDDYKIGYDYVGHVNGPKVLRNFVEL